MAVYEHGIEAKAGAVIGSPKSSAAPLPTRLGYSAGCACAAAFWLK